MGLWGWRQVKKLHQGKERSRPRSEPLLSLTRCREGKQCQRELSRWYLEEGFGKLSGEEAFCFQFLVAVSITETSIFASPRGPATACRYTAVLPSYSVSFRLDGVSGKAHPNDADTRVLSAP